MRRLVLAALLVGLGLAIAIPPHAQAEPSELRAGAWSVDVSPTEFPVIVNGGFLAARSDRVLDPLKAKCLVLDNGETKLAIVVVDVCMMTRELIDGAKKLASERTGISIDRMLVSATHPHSAGSCMPARLSHRATGWRSTRSRAGSLRRLTPRETFVPKTSSNHQRDHA